MSKSREQILDYLSEIDIEGKTVLDVGCGPKKYWAKNWVKGEAYEYVTLDIDEEFEPDIVADLNEFMVEELFTIPCRFDVVFCLETLEHIYNPIQAARNLSEWTKTGGVCYISVPFINPIHDKWDYLRYTDEWFKEVLPEVGFKEVEVKYRMATAGLPDLYSFYKKEGLRMSKIRLKKGEAPKQALIGLFVIARK